MSIFNMTQHLPRGHIHILFIIRILTYSVNNDKYIIHKNDICIGLYNTSHSLYLMMIK